MTTRWEIEWSNHLCKYTSFILDWVGYNWVWMRNLHIQQTLGEIPTIPFFIPRWGIISLSSLHWSTGILCTTLEKWEGKIQHLLSNTVADRGNHSLNMDSQLPEQGASKYSGYTPRAPSPFRDSLCVRMSGIPGPNQRINERSFEIIVIKQRIICLMT